MKRILLMILLALSGLPTMAQEGEATLYKALDLLSGPGSTSSYLSPDGTKLLHVQGRDFCLYTSEGEQLACVNVEEQTGARVRPDNESFAWSPDSRHVAFAEPSFTMLTDSDIWVLDTDDMSLTNLTDDGYGGRVGFSEPEAVSADSVLVDLTPAWHPDGRLTFVRYPYNFESAGLSVWSIDIAGGEPEPLFEVVPSNTYRYFVLSLDWSDDGSSATYVIDSPRNPIAGVWVYETERERARPIYYVSNDLPGVMQAEFSPDGQQVLINTGLIYAYGQLEPDEKYGSGFFVVGIDASAPRVLYSEGVIYSAGWLPDGQLVYSAFFVRELERSGLFVTDDAEAEGTRVFALDVDSDALDSRFSATTSMKRQPFLVAANGLMAMAIGARDTYILQFQVD